MINYRIELSNGRVVGPLQKEEVGELYARGHLSGTERGQIFPHGDWKVIANFSEINEILLSLMAQKISLNQLKQKGIIFKK